MGEGGRVFRNNNKRHVDKTKEGERKQGEEEGLAGVGGSHGA